MCKDIFLVKYFSLTLFETFSHVNLFFPNKSPPTKEYKMKNKDSIKISIFFLKRNDLCILPTHP